MSLNIKNPRTHQIAREVAAITGESVTEAVTKALEERLVRLRQRDAKTVAEKLLAIGRDASSRMNEDYRRLDYDELLYDEKGMPK